MTDFDPIDATISDIHAAYAAGTLTCRALVQFYLDRIETLDRGGPNLNSVISTNPKALEQADALDAAFAKSGPVGPLHGIPLVMKDQGDVAEMPTTMGSVLFKDHMPGRDCFVAAQMKAAGAIFIAKTTLGECGAGDTHGSLFGSTRCVYDLDRTAGGSSGGTGTAVSANLCAAGVGQEGLASIRRPSIWNGIVGMRPSGGLVSRGGVYDGWPSVFGSLGPMARTVTDAAKLLDCMVGYDPEDPVTARGAGAGMAADSYATLLADGAAKDALCGARIGVLRETVGWTSEPDLEDFARITAAFDRALGELKAAGAEIVDPIVIPDLRELLAKRAAAPDERDATFDHYFAGSANPPFKSRAEAMASPLYQEVTVGVKNRWEPETTAGQRYEYLVARDELMTRLMKVMADNRLDAIVHKAVEHEPTLIKDGVNPPYVTQKGAPAINTFLTYVPSVVVPAGFTTADLPAGITFLGRPYSDADMLRYAYAYEQATQHRRIPSFDQ
jgi:amidase